MGKDCPFFPLQSRHNPKTSSGPCGGINIFHFQSQREHRILLSLFPRTSLHTTQYLANNRVQLPHMGRRCQAISFPVSIEFKIFSDFMWVTIYFAAYNPLLTDETSSYSYRCIVISMENVQRETIPQFQQFRPSQLRLAMPGTLKETKHISYVFHCCDLSAIRASSSNEKLLCWTDSYEYVSPLTTILSWSIKG